MRRLFLLLIIITPLLIFSQEKNNPLYTISGKIIDASTLLPLEDATIVFKSIDSSQIKFGAITNQRGKFSIEVEKGTYDASVEFLSYKTKKLNISTISRSLNIGAIELEVDTEYLSEIEIIGEKKALELKPNKLVFNVDKDIASEGSMAIDILNNIPAVSVDPDGSITLRGFNTPTVLVNGKTSSLSKTDALKTIPAGSIEKIEVITNPGARYKASATGIINIILKKGKDEGLNSSLTSAGGYKDYYGGLLTLNQKSKKLNFFTNASYFHRNPIKIASFENEYFENGTTSAFLNENSVNNNKANGFYSTIGADFYLSDNSTLTASINYTNISDDRVTETNSDFFDPSHNLTEINQRTHLGKFDNEIVEIAINFDHNFKKIGQKLETTIQYESDVETYNNTITNTNSNFTDEQYVEKTPLEHSYFDITYSNPINKTLVYSVGYSFDTNNFPFTYTGDNNILNIDYTDTAHAVFIDFENEGEKFYYNIGLRAEFSELNVDSANLNTPQINNFNDLFPSAYFEYTINEKKNVSFSFGKYIQRPNYYRLQPYEQRYSETSSYKGNENLKPVYLDYFSLDYTFSNEKLTFSAALFYQVFKDYWQDVTYETGEQINGVNKIITTPFNVGSLDYSGLNISTILRASNRVSFTGNISFLYFDRVGKFETLDINNEVIQIDYTNTNVTGSFSLLAQVKIPNVFNFQTNIKHRLNSSGSVAERKANTYASAAITKDIFDKNASLSLTIDDVFKSIKVERDRFDTTYFSKSNIKNKYRTVLLSFTYRFNQSKKDRKIDFAKKDIKPIY